MPDYSCDVFVAYSLADRAWVQNDLVPRLLVAGLSTFADHRDSALGTGLRGSGESPIYRSRMVLLVLSAQTGAERRAQIAAFLERLAERSAPRPQVLAVLLGPCELNGRLASLTPLDFSNPAGRIRQMRRLMRRLGRKNRIFMSYQQGAEPDAVLAGQLAARLERAGHQVARGHELLADLEWASAARRELAASDYVVALLSSGPNEVVASQLEYAHQQFLEHGRPRILPVRIDDQERLPYQIGMYLDRLPAAAWRSRADTRRLTVQLCDAIGHRAAFPAAPPARPRPSDIQALALPPAYADPRFLAAGYPLGATPGGTMRPDAATYIDREADARMRDILRGARGVTATIRAPRQSGKSSLLLRGLMQIQAQGSQLVFIDLQAAAFDSSIYGSVEDGGRGISGARLRITSADGRNSFNVRTGRGGVYSVPGLGCTKWTVRLLSVPNAPNGISANAVIVRNLNGGRYTAAEVRFRLQR